MKEVSDNIFFNVKEIETLSIPSKTVLLEEGKIADKIYLVRKGCLRLFFYNEGKDITFQFFFEESIVASFDSMYAGQPSLFSLESIEPTTIRTVSKKDFYDLVNKRPEAKQEYEHKIIDKRRSARIGSTNEPRRFLAGQFMHEM